MAFTEQEKIVELKRILKAKVNMIDSVEALKSLIGSAAWDVVKMPLKNGLQSDADAEDDTSQAALTRKANLLALKDEIDEF